MKYLSGLIVTIGILCSIQGVALAAGFTDTNGHWAKQYIERIAEEGIVQGKTPSHYAPDDNVSRAELLKIALNAFSIAVDSEVTEDVLSDVTRGDWFAPYVRAAFRNKIIYGFNNGFGPNTSATRGMAVTILTKAAGYSDVESHFSENYATIEGLKTANFSDVPLDAYYAPYIAYLYDMQVIDGYEDGSFGPGNPITRAEIAKIVANMLDKIAPVEIAPVEVSASAPEEIEPEDREIAGTYYKMSGRGSALYFRTDDEPEKELHLQNAELFMNDQQLYKDLGLEEIYEVNDPGCSSFWGKATIKVTAPQVPDEENSAVGFAELIEKDEPTCGPSEYQMENNPVLENCGAFQSHATSYDPADTEYEVCYDEAFKVYTDSGCYLMDLQPIDDPDFSYGYNTYSLDGEEIGSNGKSTDSMTIDYDKCVPVTAEYFNLIVK